MGGFLHRLRNAFRPQAATLQSPPDWLVQALRGGKGKSGVNVTALNVLGLATVYACLDVISKTIATIPLKVYRRTETGAVAATEHPLYSILHHAPNDEMTSVDFRRSMQIQLSIWNNAYAEIVRNNAGQVTSLVPIVGSVSQKITESGSRFYETSTGNIYSSAQVLHLRDFSEYGFQGLSKVSLLREVFGLALALETNASTFFGNGSRPGLVVEHPKELSTEAFERLESSLNARKGVENAYRTLILEEGMKIAAAMNRSENRESQFDESRTRQGEEIARVFGVPQHKVGILTNATYSNIDSQEISYVTGTITPITVNWEQALTQKLLTPREQKRGYFLEFDLRGLVRGDIETRYKSYALGRQWGWLSRNDIRRLENMSTIEGGDDYLTPMNMTALGEEDEDNEEIGAASNRLKAIAKTNRIKIDA